MASGYVGSLCDRVWMADFDNKSVVQQPLIIPRKQPFIHTRQCLGAWKATIFGGSFCEVGFVMLPFKRLSHKRDFHLKACRRSCGGKDKRPV